MLPSRFKFFAGDEADADISRNPRLLKLPCTLISFPCRQTPVRRDAELPGCLPLVIDELHLALSSSSLSASPTNKGSSHCRAGGFVFLFMFHLELW
jgi:hypothetical protein